jgi:hypothetical protein
MTARERSEAAESHVPITAQPPALPGAVAPGRRRGGGRRTRSIERGSPEWNAAVNAALARAVAAGRLPERPPKRLLDRIADLMVLKERQQEQLDRVAHRPFPVGKAATRRAYSSKGPTAHDS